MKIARFSGLLLTLLALALFFPGCDNGANPEPAPPANTGDDQEEEEPPAPTTNGKMYYAELTASKYAFLSIYTGTTTERFAVGTFTQDEEGYLEEDNNSPVSYGLITGSAALYTLTPDEDLSLLGGTASVNADGNLVVPRVPGLTNYSNLTMKPYSGSIIATDNTPFGSPGPSSIPSDDPPGGGSGSPGTSVTTTETYVKVVKNIEIIKNSTALKHTHTSTDGQTKYYFEGFAAALEKISVKVNYEDNSFEMKTNVNDFVVKPSVYTKDVKEYTIFYIAEAPFSSDKFSLLDVPEVMLADPTITSTKQKMDSLVNHGDDLSYSLTGIEISANYRDPADPVNKQKVQKIPLTAAHEMKIDGNSLWVSFGGTRKIQISVDSWDNYTVHSLDAVSVSSPVVFGDDIRFSVDLTGNPPEVDDSSCQDYWINLFKGGTVRVNYINSADKIVSKTWKISELFYRKNSDTKYTADSLGATADQDVVFTPVNILLSSYSPRATLTYRRRSVELAPVYNTVVQVVVESKDGKTIVMNGAENQGDAEFRKMVNISVIYQADKDETRKAKRVNTITDVNGGKINGGKITTDIDGVLHSGSAKKWLEGGIKAKFRVYFDSFCGSEDTTYEVGVINYE